jgi:transposase
MQLTDKQRYEIVILKDQGYKINEIAEKMNINRKAVFRWIDRYIRNDNVNRKEGSGRKPKTSSDEDDIIIDIVRKNNNFSIKEIKNLAEKNFIFVSKSTIYRILHKYDYVYKNPIKKPFLTDKHKKNDLSGPKIILKPIGKV